MKGNIVVVFLCGQTTTIFIIHLRGFIVLMWWVEINHFSYGQALSIKSPEPIIFNNIDPYFIVCTRSI